MAHLLSFDVTDRSKASRLVSSVLVVVLLGEGFSSLLVDFPGRRRRLGPLSDFLGRGRRLGPLSDFPGR